jgi:Zn-dependent protease
MSEASLPLQIASWLIPLIFAIVFHEVAHGWVAYAFGDPTAKLARRLTLNPIRHVDPVGTVVLPLILAVTGAPIFGWAKPVPVVAERLRNPRIHMMLVALAGPGINFILAFLAALLLGFDVIRSEFFQLMLFNFVAVNLFLALFNLLPIPPFDGGHVVEGLLPRPLAVHYRKLARWGFPILFLLLLVVPMIFKVNIVAKLIMPIFQAVLEFYARVTGL